MRHQVKTQRANRNRAHLDAMLSNLAASIILYEKVKTTEAKAKLVKPLVEKMITVAKKKSLPIAMRELNQVFYDKNVAKKLTRDLKDRYKDRSSGFVRLTRIGFRAGDAAFMVNVELV